MRNLFIKDIDIVNADYKNDIYLIKSTNQRAAIIFSPIPFPTTLYISVQLVLLLNSDTTILGFLKNIISYYNYLI